MGAARDAKQREHIVDIDQFLQRLHGLRRHVLVVLDDDLDLAPVDAAGSIDLIGSQAYAQRDGVAELPGGAGVGLDAADDDLAVGYAGVRGHRCAAADDQSCRGYQFKNLAHDDCSLFDCLLNMPGGT